MVNFFDFKLILILFLVFIIFILFKIINYQKNINGNFVKAIIKPFFDIELNEQEKYLIKNHINIHENLNDDTCNIILNFRKFYHCYIYQHFY